MAPGKDAPKDRIDMIADISKTGKLVEMGCDPFTRAPENKAAATQTEGIGAKQGQSGGGGASADAAGGATEAQKAMELVLANKDVVKPTDSPASQVLRLVVGLLGMEVHERPSTWAESWLTFQDQTMSSLGLGSKKSPRKESDVGQEVPVEWQMRVLESLRQHVDSRMSLNQGEHDALEGGHDWGPDFPEHLNLAEFALRRITHAVGVLEDPEKHDRPILLREYTEEMVLKVAKDLRQWIHQLGTLLGLYHVHLLDLECDRAKWEKRYEDQQAKTAAGEEERKDALRKYEVMNDFWGEEKMKRDAERILGITLAGGDAKIYTQNDVDEMFAKWEKENVDPLVQEIKELRMAKEDLMKKLKGQPRPVRAAGEPVHDYTDPGEPGMGKAALALLVGIVDGFNERLFDDPMNRLLSRLGVDIKDGGHNLAEILADVQRLSINDRPGSQGSKGPSFGLGQEVEGDNGAIRTVEAMCDEFAKLENEARAFPIGSGADKLSFFGAWARDSANMLKGVLEDPSSQGRFIPPPKWDLKFMNNTGGGPVNRPGTVQSVKGPAEIHTAGDDTALRKQIEADFQRQMNALRRELEAKIKEAQEAAARERLNAQEALERLADEAAKADATLAELRRKIQMLERLLAEKGLGKQAEDAIWGAGLSEFMHGRDVFERLYRDALDRMRRMAESQARWFEESSAEFLRSIGSTMDPHLRLPGMMDPGEFQEPPPIYIPRTAGGILPTSRSPPRSRSPPSSTVSPRVVQTAPSRMSKDPLSVARLLTPANLAATPIAMRDANRDANRIGRIQTGPTAHVGPKRVAPPMRGREVPADVIPLSINSASTPVNSAEGPVRRPLTQHNIAQMSLKSRQNLGPPSRGGVSAMSSSAGFGSLGPLPPLECKGNFNRAEGSRSPSRDDLEARASKLRGARTCKSPPPGVREAKADAERLKKAIMLNAKDDIRDPLLSIGSLSKQPSGPHQGLLPPGMSNDQRVAAAKGAVRPATHSGNGGAARLARQAASGGSLSMPQLGIPRLLVQSVGAAY